MSDRQTSDWEAKAKAKRKETLRKIPKPWLLPEQTIAKAKESRSIVGDFIESILDAETRKITGRTSENNLNRMAEGTLTAVDHVKAFCKRAAIANQINQNLLEIRFDLALKRAEELDQYFRKHGKLYGPLHGKNLLA
jgi:amidase